MFWLRSALLYLGVTALIGGAIWLFWGKTIEMEWKKVTAANPQIKKSQADLEKKAKAALPKEVAAPKLPQNAAAEWNKAKSGAVSLIDLHANENRREIQTALNAHDARTVEILTTLRIKRPAAIAPPTGAPEAPPVKKAEPPVVTKPQKKAQEKKLRPMI